MDSEIGWLIEFALGCFGISGIGVLLRENYDCENLFLSAILTSTDLSILAD
jgi:hypothetical protein